MRKIHFPFKLKKEELPPTVAKAMADRQGSGVEDVELRSRYRVQSSGVRCAIFDVRCRM